METEHFCFCLFHNFKVHHNTQLRVFQQTKKLSSSLWPKLVLPTGIRRTEHPVRQALSFLILKTFSTVQLWWQSVFLALQVGHEEVLSRPCHSTANLFMPVEYVKHQYLLTNIDISLTREIKVHESYCSSRNYVSSGYSLCLKAKSCDKHDIANAIIFISSLRPGLYYQRFGTSVSSPTGKYEALGYANRREVYTTSSSDVELRQRATMEDLWFS